MMLREFSNVLESCHRVEMFHARSRVIRDICWPPLLRRAVAANFPGVGVETCYDRWRNKSRVE